MCSSFDGLLLNGHDKFCLMIGVYSGWSDIEENPLLKKRNDRSTYEFVSR